MCAEVEVVRVVGGWGGVGVEEERAGAWGRGGGGGGLREAASRSSDCDVSTEMLRERTFGPTGGVSRSETWTQTV